MQNKSLKIAVFHLGFFFSGGGEKLVIEEALGLSRMGHSVDLYGPVIDVKKCFPDLIKKVNVKPLFYSFGFHFPLRDFIAITFSIIFAPLTFWRFKKYDIFFGANQPGPVICYFLSRILKKPYVIYLAQPTRLLYPREIDRRVGFGKGSFDAFYILTKIFKPLVYFIDKLSITQANAICANGNYIADILNKTYGIKTIVCPAGTHIPKTVLSQSDRWSGGVRIGKSYIKKPYILVTNRHFPQKKFEYAIHTLKYLIKRFQAVNLVITGAPTAYTQKIVRLSHKLGVFDLVFFLGLVNEADLTKLYKNACLYLYTSPQEDFGMGVIEAMAAGIPVVAWDSAGPKTTVINGKTGFLAKKEDINDFSSKALIILKDKRLSESLGEGARRQAYRYSYGKHIEILSQTLENSLKP